MILAEILLGIDSLFDLVLSGSSLVVGGLVGIFTSSSVVGLAVSAILVVVYWALGRKFLHERLAVEPSVTNVDRIVGHSGTVVRTTKNGKFVVKVDGEEWTATASEQLQPNDNIIVNTVSGTVLEVSKA